MMRLIAFANLRRLVAPTILGAFTLGCSAICIAGDNGQVLRAVVKTGDLNLSTPEGAARIYSRLYAAAYEVCESYDTDGRDRLDLVSLTKCVDGAVRNAVLRAGYPALLAIYNARNRRQLPITVAAAQNR